MRNLTSSRIAALAVSATLALGLVACGSGSSDQNAGAPEKVKMTWFGITNWHYQVGDLGILQDAAAAFNQSDAAVADAIVKRTNKAFLDTGHTVDVIILGHLHGDHSENTPDFVKLNPKARYYASSKAGCDEAIARGVEAARCTAVIGGEVFKLNDFVTMYPVRWVHSVTCTANTLNGGGIETIGYLFKVQSKNGILSWFTHDSGAGGAELVAPRIVNGVNYGAPWDNLAKAMRAAGLTTFDVWQGGPESRMVGQARYIVPVYRPKYFTPNHLNARGGFDLLRGIHYPYKDEDQPKMKAFMESYGIPSMIPINYFDAWDYDSTSMRKVGNAPLKAAMGLPAEGPGPQALGTNPRTASELECPQD